MWSRPPHKRMLDHLWYTGVLSTTRRDGITKVYDLTEQVIPAAILAEEKSEAEQIDWLCGQALEEHLAFGDGGDIQRFWGAVSPAEARPESSSSPTWSRWRSKAPTAPGKRPGARPTSKPAWPQRPRPCPALRFSAFDPVIREPEPDSRACSASTTRSRSSCRRPSVPSVLRLSAAGRRPLHRPHGSLRRPQGGCAEDRPALAGAWHPLDQAAPGEAFR